jgi:PPOX class probable F420-dependent enzyme
MKLNDAAHTLIGDGANATLVTVNADGTPQVSVVWVGLESTPDGDEVVTAHLGEHKKVRNIRQNPHVKLTIIDTGSFGQVVRPYLAVTGTARIVEGGAPQLLAKLASAVANPAADFPPHDAPPGFITRIRIDTIGGTGPWKPGSRL